MFIGHIQAQKKHTHTVLVDMNASLHLILVNLLAIQS